MPDVRNPRHALLTVLAALVSWAALAGAPNAVAATPCAEQVVADWYGDGRVDKIYPRECYRAAIRSLPIDVLEYSNAEQDILRALQYARQGKPDPGPSGGPAPTTEDPTTPEPPTTPDGTSTGPVETGPDSDTVAGPDDGVDTSGPSSIPIPLFVLGGLALLLLAAGAAGYLSRRAQARGPDDPPTA